MAWRHARRNYLTTPIYGARTHGIGNQTLTSATNTTVSRLRVLAARLKAARGKTYVHGYGDVINYELRLAVEKAANQMEAALSGRKT